MKAIFGFLALICAILFACKDDRFTPYIANIDECHFSLNLDSLQTINGLIGTWKWFYEDQLTFDGYVGTNTSHSGLFVQIKSNGELIIYNNNEMVEVTTWIITPSAGGLSSGWILETEPHRGFIDGPIRFCDEYLSIRNSITDGSDQYYQKVASPDRRE